MSKKIIFLDRDGVINKEVGYLHKIKDFEFIDGVFGACMYLQKLDYQLIIVTNQSGISRGYYSEDEFHAVNNWMLEQFSARGVDVLDVFFCPHGPEDGCSCRKPKPGMLLTAKEKHDIDTSKSWMIGDKEADVSAANAAGINNTILVKSGHDIDEENSNANYVLGSNKQAQTVIKD